MQTGFTGTQQGMTDAQIFQVEILIFGTPPVNFHHGMCLGADDTASFIAHDRGAHCVGHPGYGSDGKPRYHGHADEQRAPFPFLVRNRHIVNETTILIAAPAGPEVRRSGTWATVRYARTCGRSIYIAWPDGSRTHEPGAERGAS